MFKQKKLIIKTVQRLILGFTLVILISHYQLVWANNIEELNNPSESTNTDNPIVCLSTSGNGYNWSSTLTWASEMLRNAVKTAPSAASYNISCVSGASSGSAFVVTYGSLLQNKQLFPRVDFNPETATKEEVLIMADSLLYMALAADFNRSEVRFYLAGDGDSNPNPPWWKSQFSHERIMLDFGTRVMLAQNISLEDVAQIKRLDEFIRYHSLDELRESANNRENRDEYRQVTFEIWDQSQALLQKLYENANFKRNQRADLDDFRTNPEHPVRQALAKKPPNGILALVYGELAFAQSIVEYKNERQKAPPYADLVPWVFANQETVKTIINSPFYQQQVKENDPYVGKYVFSVVNDYFTMLNYGLREPDSSPVAIYKLSPFVPNLDVQITAGIGEFYQPNAEQKWEENPQFELMRSSRMWKKDNNFYSAYLGVAGGWIDSNVGGQATLYLGSGYGAKLEDSTIYFSTFSRQDQVSQFTRNVLRNYFAPENTEQAIEQIEKHRQHLATLIEQYANFYPEHKIVWQPIFVDWEMRFFSENQTFLQGILSLIDDIIKLGFNNLPVAINRQSNYMLARTMNVVRYTLGDDVVQAQGLIYDRAFQDSLFEPIAILFEL